MTKISCCESITVTAEEAVEIWTWPGRDRARKFSLDCRSCEQLPCCEEGGSELLAMV